MNKSEKPGRHFPNVDILTTYITLINGVPHVGALYRPSAVRGDKKTVFGIRCEDGVILVSPHLAGFAPLFYRQNKEE